MPANAHECFDLRHLRCRPQRGEGAIHAVVGKLVQCHTPALLLLLLPHIQHFVETALMDVQEMRRRQEPLRHLDTKRVVHLLLPPAIAVHMFGT